MGNLLMHQIRKLGCTERSIGPGFAVIIQYTAKLKEEISSLDPRNPNASNSIQSL
jgi:hypothetical protein